MNSNLHCSCTWIYCARDKMHYSCTVYGSHNTIHTFKNYFVTVFSVFSKINCIVVIVKVEYIMRAFGLDWISRLCFTLRFLFFFFFFLFWSSRTIWPSQPWTVHGCTVHGSHKFHFSTTFSLKMGPTILFTHLKIISLQCFQFQ